MGKREKKGAAAYVGFDVGKASHRACAVDAAGAFLFNRRVDNRPAAIDRPLADAGPGTAKILAHFPTAP